MSSYISIDGWKSNIRFSSAHIIPEYEKCGRLHGHTYAVHLKVFGEKDKKGIIIDFTIVKEILREIVNNLDHKVLIPEKNNTIKINESDGSISIVSDNKRYVFPKSDCVFLPIESTSAENLASYILEEFLDKISFSKNIDVVEIGVDECFGQGTRISRKI